MTTENMIKGRRTSPDTGVGRFSDEMASGSGDDTPEEESGVLRRRGVKVSVWMKILCVQATAKGRLLGICQLMISRRAVVQLKWMLREWLQSEELQNVQL